MKNFPNDVRLAIRQFMKNPGFTVAAVLTLALGIGANTAIFQLLDAVRLRSLPLAHPEELAEIRIVGGNHGMGVNSTKYGQLTRPIWEEIRKHQQAFSGVFAWDAVTAPVGEGDQVHRVNAIFVSGEFFNVLGIKPWRGRLILPEDEAGGCPERGVVVSHGYWQREMGARELDSNSKLTVYGGPRQVLGVTPPDFFGLAVGESFDIALPYCEPKEPLRRDVFGASVMGRLRPGWTLERASAHLGALSSGIFEATAITGYSSQAIEFYKHLRLAAYSARAGVSDLREKYDSSLWLLLGTTGLVLLIASANLANLMLARASARQREIAVRLALGASRRRLILQLLTESALLALTGATAGAFLAQFFSRGLVRSLSTQTVVVDLQIETDWRVLLFAIAVTATTCAIFAIVPALRSTQTEPIATLKSAGRGMTAGREGFSLQRLVITAQIAISLVLLVAALLFVRSFRNLVTFDPGMRRDGITVAFVGFPQARVPAEHLEEFKHELMEEVSAVPGVVNAATTTMVPLIGGGWNHNVHVGAVEASSMFTWVSPSYFPTMGIPLVTGRNFTSGDTVTTQRVAVVNQAFVHKFLGDADPLGKTLRTDPEPNYPSTVYEIVGVIPDTKYEDIRGDFPPMAFAPASQFPAPGPFTAVMIYSNLSAADITASVKQSINRKHPEVVMQFVDFQGRIRDGLVRDRMMAMLAGSFGMLAVLLTMIGLYGVISYMVARRRNEIGIRIALGAERKQVVGMVMRQAGRWLVIGACIGTALSLIAGRGVSSLLFGLKPYDPFTLVVAYGLLAVIACTATFVPALRAAKVDPMVALRYE